MQAALSQQALFAMARCIDNDIKELLVLGEDLGFSCSASSPVTGAMEEAGFGDMS